MENLAWGERATTSSNTTLPLSMGDAELAVFSVQRGQEKSALVAGETWTLSVPLRGAIEATLADGRVFRATPDKPQLARARRIEVDFAGAGALSLINEDRTDWVIDSAEGEKLGQFTGANNGVRRVVVEMEPDAELSAEQAAFTAWVARLALESRMISSTVVLTICLLILTPIILWIFFI